MSFDDIRGIESLLKESDDAKNDYVSAQARDLPSLEQQDEQEFQSFLADIEERDLTLLAASKKERSIPPIRNRADPHSTIGRKTTTSSNGAAAKSAAANEANEKKKPNSKYGYDYFNEWDKFNPDQVLEAQEREESNKKPAKGAPVVTTTAPQKHSQYDGSKLNKVERELAAKREKEKGNECYRCGEYSQAVEFFNRSLALVPADATVYSNLAQAKIMLKDFKGAEKDSSDAIKLKPEWAKAYYRRGIARRSLLKYPEAKEDFELCLQFEPDNSQAKDQLKQVEKRLAEIAEHEKWQKKKKMVIEEVEDDEDDEEEEEVAVPINKSKSAPSSTTPSQPPQQQQPKQDSSKNAELALAEKESGNQFFRKGDNQGAIDAYSRSLQLDPSSVTVLCNRAQAYLNLQRWNDAVKDCDSALEIDGSLAKAFFRRAVAKRNLRELRAALADVTCAMNLEKGNVQIAAEEKTIRKQLEQVEAKQREEEEAKQKKKEEEEKGLRKMKIQVVEDDDDDDDDDEEEEKTKVEKKDVDINKIVAEAAKAKEAAAAAAAVAAHISSSSSSSPAPSSPPRVEEQQKPVLSNEEKALLEKAMALKAEGNDLFKKGLHEQSRAKYHSALSLLSKSPHPLHFVSERVDLLNNSALTWQQQHSYREVIKDCSAALDLWINNSKALMRRAIAFEAIEEYDAALTDINAALQMHPDLPILKQAAARLVPLARSSRKANEQEAIGLKEKGNVAFQERRYADAESLFTRAIQKDPQNMILYSNRATTRFNLGDMEGSLADASRCVSSSPSNVKAWYRKGLAHRALGDAEKALIACEEGLKYHPDHPQLVELAKELKADLGVEEGESKEKIPPLVSEKENNKNQKQAAAPAPAAQKKKIVVVEEDEDDDDDEEEVPIKSQKPVSSASSSSPPAKKIEEISSPPPSKSSPKSPTTTTTTAAQKPSTSPSSSSLSTPPPPSKPTSSSSSSPFATPSPSPARSPAWSPSNLTSPSTGADFVRNWRNLERSDPSGLSRAQFLLTINPPSKLSSLLFSEADEELISSLFSIVAKYFLSENEEERVEGGGVEVAVGVVEAVAKMDRIEIVMSFPDDSTQKTVSGVLSALEKRGVDVSGLRRTLLP